MLGGITDIVIGARDLAPWDHLLTYHLGYEAARSGRDGGPLAASATAARTFAKAGLEGGRFRVLQVPDGIDIGRPSVKQAGYFDIDVYVLNMLGAYSSLKVEGYPFFSQPETWALQSPPLRLTEAMMQAPDNVNLAFMHSMAPRGVMAWAQNPNHQYSEVTSAIAVVPDLDAAIAFWRDAMGLSLAMDLTLQHPAFEPLLGVRADEQFRMAMLSAEGGPTGRIELIGFPSGGLSGDNTAAQAPGALGQFAWAFRVADAAAAHGAAVAAGGASVSAPAAVADDIHGDAVCAAFRSPDGLLVEVWQER
jgi:catechol 2,3-dioxygenase-like lactoylglutathione lyase family enzyme